MNASEQSALLSRIPCPSAGDVQAVIGALTGQRAKEKLPVPENAAPVDTEAILLYQAQLLWVISAQLNALLGGENYPLPDVLALLERRQL